MNVNYVKPVGRQAGLTQSLLDSLPIVWYNGYDEEEGPMLTVGKGIVKNR
jgi:hypothetical protein